MIRNFKPARAILRQAVADNAHLCFTIGGLVGDWPAVAALEAIRQKRRFVAWIDRVEPEIIRQGMKRGSVLRRMKNALTLPVMERYVRFILARSCTALLQGMDTFEYFHAAAPNPHCIYDTHTTQADQIDAAHLLVKQVRIATNAPLEIVYAGRAAQMKGTDDWLDVLILLKKRGVPFRARWFGDGPELAAMQRRVIKSALQDNVLLQGFEPERSVVLSAMRDSDIFLFCHKTPESPRCLIEALVCGCPIVGYDSAYAAGLVAENGGAALTQSDQVEALASKIESLHHNRPQLAKLVGDAATSGRHYNEDKVYQHRARLMGAA